MSEPPERLIPLAHLSRLALQPGDTLVVTAPSDYMPACREMQERLTRVIADWHPGCRLLVLPKSSTAAVLTAQRGEAPEGLREKTTLVYEDCGCPEGDCGCLPAPGSER